MKQKIVFAQPLKKQILEVDHEGISYTESGGIGMGDTSHHFFPAIDAVLKKADEPVLSIQVGDTIYKLRYNESNKEHRAVIDQIVAGAQKTV